MERVDLSSSNRVCVCGKQVVKAWSDAYCQEYLGTFFLSFCEDNHISVPIIIAITAASVIVLSYPSDPAMSSEHLFFFFPSLM